MANFVNTARLSCAFIVILFAPLACHAAVICADSGAQYQIAADGHLLVWTSSPASGDIIGFDLLTSTQFTVCSNPSGQAYPDVSGNIVVWEDSRNATKDIYAYDIADANEFPVCTALADQRYPQISGSIVVWQDYRNGNYDIYGYDLSTHTEFPICTNAFAQTFPAIDGDIVVWEDARSGNKDIYAYNLATHTEIPVCVRAADQSSPAVLGSVVLWQDNRNGNYDIYACDLSTLTEFSVCSAATDQTSPSASDSVVVWQDMRSGNADIYSYNLNTHLELAICSTSAQQTAPAINSMVIAWTDNRNDPGAGDVYAMIRGDEYQTALGLTEGVPFNGSTLLATSGSVTLPGWDDIYDVWHVLQPPRTGYYNISLCGSDFDTTLAVYKSDLTLLASNDDSCGFQSALTSPKLSPAMTYYVRVAGYGRTQGDYHLLLTDSTDCINPPSADLNKDCEVNFNDYSILASQWLACGKALPSTCP